MCVVGSVFLVRKKFMEKFKVYYGFNSFKYEK